MDIDNIATEFIEVNRRRKELEKREEYLKGILVEHFQSTKTLSLDTDKGRISYQASQHTDYDIPLLRESLPESIFQLVTKLSVNDTLLTQLIKDGKIDDTKVARARRVRSVYRIVVQSLPNISPLRPVSKESPVISPVQPLSGKKARSKTGGQQGKAKEKTPRPGGRQKPEKQLKDTEKQPKK
ncbi:MAG: hypothetical protein GX338_05640 [Firmicutes bacterium]|jgi:succinyl-CoA synthetase beta subunit|nr:hypothetical protein [Bacillota bacterium]